MLASAISPLCVVDGLFVFFFMLFFSRTLLLLLNFGYQVHTFAVELGEVPREIEDIKSIGLTDAELTYFKHEPIGVTPRVGIHFHQQVVLILGLQVNRIEITTFKILIKDQDVFLVDILPQFRLEKGTQVIHHVLRYLVLRDCFHLVLVFFD